MVSVIKASPDHPRLQISVGNKREKSVTKPLIGHFSKNGATPKIRLAEFTVMPDAVLPPGILLKADSAYGNLGTYNTPQGQY